MTEILLILAIALLFFGPSRLPGLGKSLGQAIRGFKKGIEGVNDVLDEKAPDASTEKQTTPAQAEAAPLDDDRDLRRDTQPHRNKERI